MKATIISIDNPEFKTGTGKNSKTGADFQWTIAQVTAKDENGEIRKYVSTFDKVTVGEEGELEAKANGQYTNYTFKKIKKDTPDGELAEVRAFVKRLAEAVKKLQDEVKDLKKAGAKQDRKSGDFVVEDVSTDAEVMAALDALDL